VEESDECFRRNIAEEQIKKVYEIIEELNKMIKHFIPKPQP